MKKLYKLLAGFLTCVLVFAGVACKKGDDGSSTDSGAGCGSGTMTLEEINKYLNDKDEFDMSNAVALIPFAHINGPQKIWDFYALINYVYTNRPDGYVKYQVTYLSCTCRTADVNYWQTAYVEITIPESGNVEDAVLKTLSFDKDIQDSDLAPGDTNYTAGFWGDSSPIFDEATHTVKFTTYDKVEVQEGDKYREHTSDTETEKYYLNKEDGKFYFPSMKYDFIPKLIGMNQAEIHKYASVKDSNGALLTDGIFTQREYDQFHGSSVSTHNIIRILDSLFKYHVDTYL